MPTSTTSNPHCARRPGHGRVATVLVFVALTGSACSLATHSGSSATPRVLGEQPGSPDVVGQPAPAGTGELGAVSCADVSHCWAVGAAGPNASATTTAATTTADVTALAAAKGHTSTTTTTPAPTVIAATTNGGLTWVAQRLDLPTPPALTGISCAGVKECMAVGSTGADPGVAEVLTTRDGGRNWAQATPPAGAVSVIAVTCGADGNCIALASNGAAIWSTSTTDFGHSWLQQGNLPAGMEAQDLSCGSTGSCLAAGYVPTAPGHGQAAVAISPNAGGTWAAATVPAGLGVLQSVTCASATRCLAAGTTSTTVSDVVPAKGELLVSTDGGQAWATTPASPPVDDVFGLDCPGGTGCAMVGTKWQGSPVVGSGAVAESTDGGATFVASATAYTPLALTSLACPTPEHCVAAGGDTLARITLPTPKDHSH